MVDMETRCEPDYLFKVIDKANYVQVCIESENYLIVLLGAIAIIHGETLTPLSHLKGSSLTCDAEEQGTERSKLHWFNFYL